MQDLLPIAERIGARLKARGETVAVFEGSTGGLVSAALLSVAGASNYFVGGGVIYTRPARAELARVEEAEMAGMRASTEPYALLLARKARSHARHHLGHRRERRHGPDRQPLRRRRRPLAALPSPARRSVRSRWRLAATTGWRTCGGFS